MIRLLLTLVGLVPLAIGLVATFAPTFLLADVKHAEPSGAAVAMARTAGVLLVAIGGLNLAVAHHPRSPTLHAVLAFDLAVQLLLLPVDPLAWWSGAYGSAGAFVPNTVLHVVLAVAFAAALASPRPS